MRSSSATRHSTVMAFGIATPLLAILSLANLHVVTSKHLARPDELVGRQALWHLVGAVCALLIARTDYRRFLRIGHAILLVSVATLVSALLVGPGRAHAARWLWVSGLRVQPSEFAAIAIAFGLARWQSDHPPASPRTLRDLAGPLAISIAPCVLVALQPDLGSAVVIGLAAVPIVLFDRVRTRALAALALGMSASAAGLVTWGLHAYQRARLAAFLHPSAHRRDVGYQAAHALDAVAAGGLSGRGAIAWRALPPRFVPDVFTDFPLASWGFVTGAAGMLTVLALYAALVFTGFRVARASHDRFGAALALGVSSVLASHVVVNVGMTLGMLPTTGVTLPFFSFGGSNTLAGWLCVGILASIARTREGHHCNDAATSVDRRNLR